jgi:hypothetical protein
MSNINKQEREDRALEALIVSQLRPECNLSDPDDLPELTAEERKAMDALPADFAKRLWNTESGPAKDEAPEAEVVVDELAFAGMNRAEAMEEDTRKALEEKRKEIIEKLRKKKQERKDA